MLNLLRANPGVIVFLTLIAIGTVVLSFFALAMGRGGGHYRSIVFIAVFMGLIILPGLIAQIVMAVRPAAVTQPQHSAFDDVTRVFGRDGLSMQDARSVFPDFFGAATRAQLCLYPSGATTTVAQFETNETLLNAVSTYMTAYGAKNLKGDERTGWRGRRPAANDFVEIYRTDRELFIWTAPTEALLAERRKASDAAIAAVAPPPPQRLFPALAPLEAMFSPTWVKVAGVLLLVLVVSTWFFKGSAWASRVEPSAGTTALPAATVRERLLAIDSLDTPMAVQASADGTEIDVTWKYADAKWVDLARAHGLNRTHRLKLSLDAADHTVRVTEQSSAYNWSAGPSGASFDWTTSRGITFFEYRHERVFGLQFTPDGKPTPNLSYAYTFDLQELKNPIIEAVTRSGWTWQPTMIDGPKALRWFTE